MIRNLVFAIFAVFGYCCSAHWPYGGFSLAADRGGLGKTSNLGFWPERFAQLCNHCHKTRFAVRPSTIYSASRFKLCSGLILHLIFITWGCLVSTSLINLISLSRAISLGDSRLLGTTRYYSKHKLRLPPWGLYS